MDFADASLIIASQKYSVKTIISLDKDFDIYRLPGKVKNGNEKSDSPAKRLT